MTTRRRIVRLTSQLTPSSRPRQLDKLRQRLLHERNALMRWQRKLRRAFNAVEKLQAKIVRIEKQLTRLEDNS